MHNRFLALIGWTVFLAAASTVLAQVTKSVVPNQRKAVRKTYPPAVGKESKSGVGKFIIFTRESVGIEWEYTASAWECIPSQPETPITKRIEFCRSSWNAGPLLNSLTADDNEGSYPRFVRLQVDGGDRYTVNLYDINYRTWDIRCIWQGDRLLGFGVLGNSIFCNNMDEWLRIDTVSGQVSNAVPFVPLCVDGDFWLVRKHGENEGAWSYDRSKRQFIAHFGPVERPEIGRVFSKLSADGKNRAWLTIQAPREWPSAGVLPAKFTLQRDSKADIRINVEIRAVPGSGYPVIPIHTEFDFTPNGNLQLRAGKVESETEDRIWNIDIVTGKVSSEVAPYVAPLAGGVVEVSGVPVPEFLQQPIKQFQHWGSTGLAPAFLLHLRLLVDEPGYADGVAGVSRDGRHVLYRARSGPMAEFYIYGDVLTKKTIRLKAPNGIRPRDAQEIVWVETP